jgi:hypothetical protein
MAFLAAAAPFLAAGGSLIKGVGGLMAGNAKKKADFRQARQERLATTAQENDLRADARRKIGEQLAGQFSNGFEGGSGTALDAIRESEINAVLDAMELRRQGVARSDAYKAEGRAAQREGRFALASGILGAASDVGSMASDWAQARSGTSR